MTSFFKEIVTKPANIPNIINDNYYDQMLKPNSQNIAGRQFNYRNTLQTFNRASFFFQK